jgi:hypothetical protein
MYWLEYSGASLLAVLVPSIAAPIICYASQTRSFLELDELGWKWVVRRRVVASQSWDESGGIRARIKRLKRLELLNFDGSVYRSIPVSDSRTILDPILTAFDRALPPGRLRAMEGVVQEKRPDGKTATRSRVFLRAQFGVMLLAVSILPLVLSAPNSFAWQLSLILIALGLLAIYFLLTSIVAGAMVRDFGLKYDEPALFRLPLPGSSPIQFVDQASKYLLGRLTRRKFLGALTLVEVQDGYIELKRFGKARRLFHGEYSIRIERSTRKIGVGTDWIVIESEPEAWIPNYRTGQISLLELLRTLEQGEQPDPALLATDVIEWLYRDQDLEEEQKQGLNS